jgi:hypothetical protein
MGARLTVALLVLSLATAAGVTTAHAARDLTPPRAEVESDTGPRCVGKQARISYRIIDAAPTRTVVKIDGEVVKRTRSKRFTIHPRLDDGRHRILATSRDRRGNKNTHTLKIPACQPVEVKPVEIR